MNLGQTFSLEHKTYSKQNNALFRLVNVISIIEVAAADKNLRLKHCCFNCDPTILVYLPAISKKCTCCHKRAGLRG